MTDLVRVKRGRHPWVTEPESGGGGGGGVTPAFIFADTSSSPSIPNDGNGVVVTFDDGVVHQDGTDITLNADQQHFDIAADGYYIATFVALFNATDPTGIRLALITVPQDLGGAGSQFSGENSQSGVSQAMQTVTAAFRANAGDSVYAVVSVQDAAGAVDLDYAEMSITKIGGDVGGGGGGSEDLATVLANGNNADNFQIKNVADGTDPQDAVSLAQLEAASVPGLDAVVAVNGNANGHDIQSVADMQSATLNVIGGDDSGPVAKIVPPVGAVNSVAEIGPQNLGLIVGPDGSVQNRADDTAPASIVAMQRGSDAVYIDLDGVHITGLVNGGSTSVLYAYPFDQDDGAAPRTLFTPDVAGEVITFVGWTNAVGWDGTTPILGFGQGVADGDFGLSMSAATLDSPAPNIGGAQQIFQGPTAGAGWLLQDLPFMLWVTQDGKKGGANPGATDSTGILYVARCKL
jgi:hypothetical protein